MKEVIFLLIAAVGLVIFSVLLDNIGKDKDRHDYDLLDGKGSK